MAPAEWVTRQVNDEITDTARDLTCRGVPLSIACDAAFDLVVAALAADAPHILRIYRAQVTRTHPAIFDHLN